ncbi:MAG: DNA-binding protein WhiA [Clostridia bacterium]|nr:DNA-binding protein WhiA [Clostridia bacterium]
MSFSSLVKEELTKIVIKDEDQRKAELAGFMITNCIVTREEGAFILKMSTENELAIRRVYTTLKTHYGIIAKSNVERPKIPGAVPLYHLKIFDKTDLKTIFDESFININEKLQIVLNDKSIILKDDECQKCFLRGVFLGSGSVINPDSRYHLEVVASNQENAIFINEIIESFDIKAKMIKRKKDYIIYLKGAESISTFLAAIGANQGTLKFEETRVIKEVRNNINRVSNFENANFDKTVDASLSQLEDIMLIRKTRKFSKLPEPLKELARLRLSYKEATFEELRKNA